MEPTSPAPTQPAPIMDVAPPPKLVAAPEPQLAQPPAEETQPAASEAAPEKAKALTNQDAEKAPKAASGTPIVAIFLAVIFFVALSALAFYAYSKSN